MSTHKNFHLLSVIAKFIVFISMFLAIALAYTVFAGAVIPDDVNGDGTVNIRDAATVLLYIGNKPVECQNNAIDSNGNGVIDAEDAKIILKNITSHPDITLHTGDKCSHALTYVAPKSSTCQEVGNIGHWSCTKCFKLFKDESAEILISSAMSEIATAHIPGEWKVEIPATKTENGLNILPCIFCDIALDSEVIPYTGSIGLSYELNAEGTAYTVTGIGDCTDIDVVIPAIYNELPVICIGKEAFYK